MTHEYSIQEKQHFSLLLRSRERGLLLLVMLLLMGLMTALYRNIDESFTGSDSSYQQGKTIKLSSHTDKGQLADVLFNGHYVVSKADASLIAGFIVDKLQFRKQLDNLGELNKAYFRMPAAMIDTSDAIGLKTQLQKEGKADTPEVTKLRLFEKDTYKQLKRNDILIVRTPAEFKLQFLFSVVLFFSVFWLIHIHWSMIRYTGDFAILPFVMLLCGLNVVMMYAIPDPLTDTMRGKQMTEGIALGGLALVLLSRLNVQRFYASSNFNLPLLGSFLSRLQKEGKLNGTSFTFLQKTYRQPGTLYVVLALGLSAWLMLAGHGPDGSGGVQVNLKIGGISLEPAEIIKYLMVVFFAAYFNRNSDYLREVPSLKWRIVNSSKVFVLFAALLLIYLILGDMGPALVLCGTFLIFYAVARGELKEMILGVLLYSLVLSASFFLTRGSAFILLLVTLFYFAFWIMYGFIRKRWHESSFLIVFVIAAFVFGGYLSAMPWSPLANVGKRLNERNDMFLHVWNNETHGGDQVAQGIWGVASGGFFGQGPGNGDPKMIQACHTDMILMSLGEELGLLGLCAVFAAIGFLLSRCLLAARRAGNPFLFYLAGGIAVVTGIQFLIIVAGSMGALPLTGVSVPFLSFGRVGMIMQMAAFGVVMAISSQPGVELQTAYIIRHYHRVIRFGQLSFLAVLAVPCFILVKYMVLNRDEYLIRPAFAVDRYGARNINYNPRIQLLMDHLSAGNIYDRNGLLMATDNKDSVIGQETLLKMAGVSDSSLARLKTSWEDRYYPFGNNLFFWTGNINNKLLWGNTQSGYLAESRQLSLLRGFDTHYGLKKDSVIAHHYLGPGGTIKDSVFIFRLGDYSVLLPMLKAGRTSRLVKDFKHRDRSIHLTVDAALQVALQRAMQADPEIKNTRNGIIVLNPVNGEVLASAVNPLPDMKLLDTLQKMDRKNQQTAVNTGKINGKNFIDADMATSNPTAPGSTAKIITALAAMNKAGLDAANKITYNISCGETIHEGVEPCGHNVGMDEAITNSSNIFFIRLANELGLDSQMIAIYQAAGLYVHNIGGYIFYNRYERAQADSNRILWINKVFMPDRESYRRNLGSKKRYQSNYFSGLAWGQGQLTATPLAMARVAGAIANKGDMQESRFLLDKGYEEREHAHKVISLADDPAYAGRLAQFMEHLSGSKAIEAMTGTTVSSKTGTPERDEVLVPGKPGNEYKDAWYVFFTYSPRLHGPIVVCIRMEHVRTYSIAAINMAKKIVVPVLQSRQYLSYHQ